MWRWVERAFGPDPSEVGDDTVLASYLGA